MDNLFDRLNDDAIIEENNDLYEKDLYDRDINGEKIASIDKHVNLSSVKKIVTPNASKFFESLRNSDITNSQALADIIDNSLDAKAKKVSIVLSASNKGGREDIKFIVLDDGCGMSRELLEEAIRMGSITGKDNCDLGRFGLGLKISSLSIGRKIEIYTKVKDDNFVSYVCQDLDMIKISNSFEVEFSAFDLKHKILEKYTFPNGQKVFGSEKSSGTVIVMSKCDKTYSVGNMSVFRAQFIEYVSRVFRKFIGETTMWVDDRKIVSDDPLEPKYDDELTASERVEYPIITIPFNNETITVRSVKLPRTAGNKMRGATDKEANSYHKSGFYVMRNNREISMGQSWGSLCPSYSDIKNSTWFFVKKHNDWNRFRAEISFSANLDKYFSVDFSKKKVMLEDEIGKVIFNKIKNHLKQVREELVSEQQKTILNNDDGDMKKEKEDAEKDINSRKSLLDLPKAPKEKRQHRSENKTVSKKSNIKKGFRGVGKNTQDNGIPNCKFVEVDLGNDCRIMEPVQVGNNIEVRLNIGHPFVRKFFIDKTADVQSWRRMMYHLMYSFATSQLDVVDSEEQLSIVDKIQNRLGLNLKKLVS